MYLQAGPPPVTAVPITMSCWVYPTNSTQELVAAAITNGSGDAWGANFLISLRGDQPGDPVWAVQNTGPSFPVAAANGSYTTNAWQHICGVFSANNSRTAYLNGSSGTTNTTSVTATTQTLTHISIGALKRATPVVFFDGRIAEVGIWNAALTAAEIASLAKGMTCDKVRPQSLVFYAPLVRDLTDVKGGLTITNNNTATVANHPRVYT
jgi:hypothetical protein